MIKYINGVSNMSKKIQGNRFIVVKKNKIDKYPLSGKVRNFCLKYAYSYLLINEKNKLVGYYVFKIEKRHLSLIHSKFEEDYLDCIGEFEERIIKDMKMKILTHMASTVTFNAITVRARPTLIPYLDLVLLSFAVMFILMAITQQIATCFLFCSLFAYFAGIQVIKKAD